GGREGSPLAACLDHPLRERPTDPACALRDEPRGRLRAGQRRPPRPLFCNDGGGRAQGGVRRPPSPHCIGSNPLPGETMLASMIGFEIRSQLRHTVPYVALILLLAIGLFYPSLLAVGQGQGTGLTQVNEPRMIAGALAVITLLAAIMPLILFSEIAHRDAE